MSSPGQPADLLFGQEPLSPKEVTPASVREVMAQFATGVILLTVGGDQTHGMTANAFTSVSLDPPQVLCCVSRTAVMHSALTSAGSFGVSVLSAEHEKTAKYFASKERPLGRAQFDAVQWWPGRRTGVPLLAGALAWLECELVAAHESGDHSIFIGAVLGLGRGAQLPGLVFFNGGFHPATR